MAVEFGTPETWGMKVGDFLEQKEFTIPQEKPQELLDLQEQNRKQRLLDSLQKIGPGLMDESLDFIRRKELKIGTTPFSLRSSLKVKKPKLYDKILELAKEGDLRLGDIRKHPEVLKLNNGKPLMFETVKNNIEMGLGKKTVDKIKNIPQKGKFKGKTRQFLEDNIDKIKKDYLKGVSVPDLTKKYLPNMKGFSTTLETVLKENVTKEEMAKRPDITGRGQFAPVKKDPKKLAAIIEDIPKMANKEVLEKHKISSTTLDEIKNEYGLKFGKMIKRPKDPAVTERIKKVAKAIEEADLPKTDIDARSAVVQNLAKKLNLPVDKFLGEVSRIVQDPDRFDVSAKLKKKINRFPDPKFVSETLKAKGFAKSTTDVVRNLEKAIKQAVSSGSNLEHALPQGLIREFKLPKKYLLTAERTTGFLNQFKKQYDNQLIKAAKEHAAGNISYSDYKKEVARISKIVSDKTGGYKIGYVDFVDGKAVPVTPQESLLKGEGDLGKKTKGLKNYFKNIIHHNKLYDNFKANPKDPAFATLRDEIKRKPGKFIRENEAEKTARAITSFTKPEQFYEFYKKNPDDVFFKALTRTASLLGGRGTMLLAGGASLPFLATALAAETGNEIEDDDSILPEAAAAAAITAPLATKKGRSIYGTAGKGLLKTLQVLGQPSIAAGIAADELRKGNIKTGGAALLAPELAGSLAPAGRGILSTIGRVAANPFGRFARAFTPVGLATIGAGALKDVYDEYQRREALTDEERLEEDIERDRAADEMMIGAAEGGRIGFADGPKDPSKRKFIKLMGIMSLLPFGIGKGFKMLEKAAPVVSEGAKLGFDNFIKLMAKIKMLGKEDPARTTLERQKATTYTGKDGSEYELIEDISTGDIRITRDKPGVAVYNRGGDDVEGIDVIDDRSTFELRIGQADESTKGKKPPDEYDEGKIVFDEDGTPADFDDVDDATIKAIEDEIN